MEPNLIEMKDIDLQEVIWNTNEYTVWKGFYRDREVAVKTLPPDGEQRFERELMTLRRVVEHPNIINVVGICKEPAMLVVTELMAGSLREVIDRIKPDKQQALNLALCISRAMEKVHTNHIIHGGLKPDTILVADDMVTAKLFDFGHSRSLLGGDLTPDVGSYPFRAPEVMLPTQKVTPYNEKVDTYSYGHILCELFTHKTYILCELFTHKTYAEYVKVNDPSQKKFWKRLGAAMIGIKLYHKEIPKEILVSIKSCCDKDPGKRPTFEQISEILDKLLGSGSTSEVKKKRLKAIAKFVGNCVGSAIMNSMDAWSEDDCCKDCDDDCCDCCN